MKLGWPDKNKLIGKADVRNYLSSKLMEKNPFRQLLTYYHRYREFGVPAAVTFD